MIKDALNKNMDNSTLDYQNHLTFDIDWAPDISINEIRKIINSAGIKATFFITHKSDILKDLIEDGHELGIHPNFLVGSSQGDTPEKAIEFLLNIVPEARALRTHALVQSSPLLQLIFSKFPQLKYDFSILMYNFPFIGKFNWQFEGTQFKRLNYNWEDDAAFYHEGFKWNCLYFPGKLNIYDFHPIHVHLNSKDITPYNALKKSLTIPLSDIGAKHLTEFINPDYGAQTFLKVMTQSNVNFIDFEGLLCASEL